MAIIDFSTRAVGASPRRAQFSLKTLMWLMLVAAAFMSGWSLALREAREAEALALREAEAARAAEMDSRLLAAQKALQAEALLQQTQYALRMSQAKQADLVKADAALNDPTAAIEAVLRQQAEAWNAGQIDRFMEHYWNSDELSFSAGGQTTRGWQPTLERYRQRYPTKEQMGRLTFDHLQIQPLGETAALVLGQWHLARAEDALDGNFSLVFRKIDDRWLIVHDHTSRAEKPSPPSKQPD